MYASLDLAREGGFTPLASKAMALREFLTPKAYSHAVRLPYRRALTSTFAPPWINKSTASRFTRVTALCSGVYPSGSSASRSAPYRARIEIPRAVYSSLVVWWIGMRPRSSRAFTSAPALMSRSNPSTSPRRLASCTFSTRDLIQNRSDVSVVVVAGLVHC